MIISYRHGFVFFAVPKTATHALRLALRPHLGPDDQEQQMLHGRQTLPVPALAALGHGHISWQEAARHLPDATLRGAFRFAFVRNPFDRFVSTCFFLNRGDPAFARRARDFMKAAIHRERFRNRVLARPQHAFLTDHNGTVQMDFLGRYETLQASFDALCDRLGLPRAPLAQANRSGRGEYGSYYDDELRDAVAEFYREDFALFGYDPVPADADTTGPA